MEATPIEEALPFARRLPSEQPRLRKYGGVVIRRFRQQATKAGAEDESNRPAPFTARKADGASEAFAKRVKASADSICGLWGVTDHTCGVQQATLGTVLRATAGGRKKIPIVQYQVENKGLHCRGVWSRRWKGLAQPSLTLGGRLQNSVLACTFVSSFNAPQAIY